MTLADTTRDALICCVGAWLSRILPNTTNNADCVRIVRWWCSSTVLARITVDTRNVGLIAVLARVTTHTRGS